MSVFILKHILTVHELGGRLHGRSIHALSLSTVEMVHVGENLGVAGGVGLARTKIDPRRPGGKLHNAFNSKEALLRILDTTVENIVAFSQGKKKNRV